ncbi:hypothetical protein [Burkholderia ubonensis]|uniref:hypothetical protein n=1 Tax=Burkholderia ubonensis TaxID=101571 RepID=UPI001E3598EA|nr:hypothetical protein [Burkholderia ubonensis]
MTLPAIDPETLSEQRREAIHQRFQDRKKGKVRLDEKGAKAPFSFLPHAENPHMLEQSAIRLGGLDTAPNEPGGVRVQRPHLSAGSSCDADFGSGIRQSAIGFAAAFKSGGGVRAAMSSVSGSSLESLVAWRHDLCHGSSCFASSRSTVM